MELKELKRNFLQALENENLDKAFAFLEQIYKILPENPSQEDWYDQKSRKLFQAFYNVKDWKNSKAVVELTPKTASKEGRIKRLEELSGMNYDKI